MGLWGVFTPDAEAVQLSTECAVPGRYHLFLLAVSVLKPKERVTHHDWPSVGDAHKCLLNCICTFLKLMILMV